MKIGTKYRATSRETTAHKIVSKIADADNAFTSQCSALIICAYFKIINAKKLKNSWDEETITQHLKKHLKLCIQEAELEYYLGPEYPEDDDEIEEGEKNVKKLIYFDLMFSSFSNKEQLYIGVEAKILLENNF